MTDLGPQLIAKLKEHRLPELDLGGDFIYPAYEGQSILNIPASLCQLLGVPQLGAGPLRPEIMEPLGGEVKRVVLVLVDALALQRLQGWISKGAAPVWGKLIEEGLLAPLTSIAPSTTSAALTTMWTGYPPAAHGVMGYEMWLKEFGLVANMILHTPSSYWGDVGGLSRAGFDPERFLPVPTLGPQLKAHGVRVDAFQHQAIANSGLSRMFFPDVGVHSFITVGDLWVGVRQLMEQRAEERSYVWVYWGAVDGVSHKYGPDDERAEAAFAAFSAAFEREFLSRLSAAARKDTLLILTADHGQVTTRKDLHYDLANHEGLTRRLHITPTGENRLAYLHIRPGQTEAVREYIERNWPGQLTIVESSYAVKAGLFGPGEALPQLSDRVGDLIVTAKGDAYWWWGAKENPILGRHGGLTPEEMLVPFLAVRLG